MIESIARLSDLNMAMLGRLFETLMKQLPEGQLLFCVVDGITYYESRLLDADLQRFISMLNNLASDTEVKAVTKVLITTPVASKCGRQVLEREQILDIPTEINRSRRSRFQEPHVR